MNSSINIAFLIVVVFCWGSFANTIHKESSVEVIKGKPLESSSGSSDLGRGSLSDRVVVVDKNSPSLVTETEPLKAGARLRRQYGYGMSGLDGMGGMGGMSGYGMSGMGYPNTMMMSSSGLGMGMGTGMGY